MTKKRNALVRALRQLLGLDELHGPRKKKISKTDIYVANGYLYLGDYELSPDEAWDIVTEILRRLK